MKGNSMIKNRGGKLVAALAATALAATSVVALGGVANAAESNTITLWAPTANAGLDNAYEAIAKAFVKKYPTYKVDFKEVGQAGNYATVISTALQAGNGPDVFVTAPGIGQGHSMVTLARAKYLLDISDTGAKTANPASLDSSVKLGGKTYGLALGIGVGDVVANISLMKSDGLSWPKTFGELLKQCGTAVTNGRTFFGLAGGMIPNLQLLMASLGQNTYIDKDWSAKRQAGKVSFANDLGWRTSYDQVKQMKAAGCFQKGAEAGGFADAIDANFFGHKAYAVFVPGATSIPFSKFVPPLKNDTIRTAYIPAVKAENTRIPSSSGYGLSVNARTKASKAAKAFINFASTSVGSGYYRAITGELPLDGKGTIPEQFELVVPLLKAKKTFELPFASFTNTQVSNLMAQGAQGILTGQTEISKILKAMDAAW
jgi:raffinose/stachyose/melibiose transport system substrate-binding protein